MMLINLLRDRITAVWIILVVATLASWGLGVGHEISAPYAGVSILLIAAVKVRFVGCYFMELRDAPVLLWWFFQGWVALVTATLVGLLLLA